LIRQQIKSDTDEFCIYSLKLRRYLSATSTKKPKYVDTPILNVLEVVAKLDVFTTPVSVFTREENLWASATFDQKSCKFYVIVSNANISLLYSVNMKRASKYNMKVIRFSQIITIKSATSLMQPNRL
jgi:hypothetical protein